MGSTRIHALSVSGRAALVAVILTIASLGQVTAGESATVSARAALDWNLNAVNAVRAAHTMDGVASGGAPRTLYQTEGLIYMSYVQAAVYDATMKISNRYKLYHHFNAKAGNASIEAAVISAAYLTLAAYLGDADGSLAAKYSADIGRLPADNRTSRGVAVGRAASADIVALRANDGRNAAVPFACPTTTTPGAWQCAPGSIQTEQTPWLAVMRPFLLVSDSQFRAPATPALNDSQYIADLNEVHYQGGSNVETTVHKPIALFWNLNAINQLNQTLRDVATQHNMDLVDTVHLLAMGELIPTDAGIACFDSKYHYMFWRPITAIRAGGDMAWNPLVVTPNYMEYPSQHGCVTSALAQVISSALGTQNINVTIYGAPVTGTTPVPRTYATVADIDNQLVDARVWIGFHYRNSVVVGETLGHSVAAWTLARYFLPKQDEED